MSNISETEPSAIMSARQKGDWLATHSSSLGPLSDRDTTDSVVTQLYYGLEAVVNGKNPCTRQESTPNYLICGHVLSGLSYSVGFFHIQGTLRKIYSLTCKIISVRVFLYTHSYFVGKKKKSQKR